MLDYAISKDMYERTQTYKDNMVNCPGPDFFVFL